MRRGRGEGGGGWGGAARGFSGEAVLKLVLGPGWRLDAEGTDRACVEGRVGGHGGEVRPQWTHGAGVGRVPGKPWDPLGVSRGQSSWAQAGRSAATPDVILR